MRSKRSILIIVILLLALCGYLAMVDLPAPTQHVEQEIPREQLLDTP